MLEDAENPLKSRQNILKGEYHMEKITKKELEELRCLYFKLSEHNSPDDLLDDLNERLGLDYDEESDISEAFRMAIFPYYDAEEQKENEDFLIGKGYVVS